MKLLWEYLAAYKWLLIIAAIGGLIWMNYSQRGGEPFDPKAALGTKLRESCAQQRTFPMPSAYIRASIAADRASILK